jgi:hypothetical protein
MTRIMGTLHEDMCTVMLVPCRILMRMKNVSGRPCREKNIHFMWNNFFPKILPFTRYVEKYGTAKQTTHNNIMLRRKDALWMPDN